jgi:hypothetical protein
MGSREEGDSQPIINEWEGAWVVPGQVRRQSMVNLRCNGFFSMSTELSLF